MSLDDLAGDAWNIYADNKTNKALVPGSMPILFFGDSTAYFQSPIKVVTVGLNPSGIEFPSSDRCCRFPKASGLIDQMMEGQHHDIYLQALNEYYQCAPYWTWFKCFKPLLAGLGADYAQGRPVTALHTDLCSPLPTDPTWSKLSPQQQQQLIGSGRALWHRLMQCLLPDVIIISVASNHLQEITFANQRGWQTIHTLTQKIGGDAYKKPYAVRAQWVTLAQGQRTLLVFGPASITPFGHVANATKVHIGQIIKERYEHGCQ